MQAFTKHIDAVLINVRASTLYSKWMGDSNRLTSAIFTLARKISKLGHKVVIFVDEVDGLLGESSHEHELSTQVFHASLEQSCRPTQIQLEREDVASLFESLGVVHAAAAKMMLCSRMMSDARSCGYGGSRLRPWPHDMHASHIVMLNSGAVLVQVKTEFMQLWDGLVATQRVIVVGATNRPDRLNDAMWRRFGRHFEVRACLCPAWPVSLR